MQKDQISATMNMNFVNYGQTSFYPRPVLAFGYCHRLRLWVCVSVCVCVCVAITSLSGR